MASTKREDRLPAEDHAHHLPHVGAGPGLLRAPRSQPDEAAAAEGAVDAGVNQVSPPALDSTERREAYRRALTNAAADARKNAEALAAAMDVDVGGVRHINAGRQIPAPLPVARGMATLAVAQEADGGQATYNPGEMRLEANITAVFDIED